MTTNIDIDVMRRYLNINHRGPMPPAFHAALDELERLRADEARLVEMLERWSRGGCCFEKRLGSDIAPTCREWDPQADADRDLGRRVREACVVAATDTLDDWVKDEDESFSPRDVSAADLAEETLNNTWCDTINKAFAETLEAASRQVLATLETRELEKVR